MKLISSLIVFALATLMVFLLNGCDDSAQFHYNEASKRQAVIDKFKTGAVEPVPNAEDCWIAVAEDGTIWYAETHPYSDDPVSNFTQLFGPGPDTTVSETPKFEKKGEVW